MGKLPKGGGPNSQLCQTSLLEVVSEEKGYLFWGGYTSGCQESRGDGSDSGLWTMLDDSCTESCHEETKPLGRTIGRNREE
jgi:hypothetical protein